MKDETIPYKVQLRKIKRITVSPQPVCAVYMHVLDHVQVFTTP